MQCNIALLFCQKIIDSNSKCDHKTSCAHTQGDNVSDLWQHEKNLKKAAKILGEDKSHLYARESTTKTKVLFVMHIKKK